MYMYVRWRLDGPISEIELFKKTEKHTREHVFFYFGHRTVLTIIFQSRNRICTSRNRKCASFFPVSTLDGPFTVRDCSHVNHLLQSRCSILLLRRHHLVTDHILVLFTF